MWGSTISKVSFAAEGATVKYMNRDDDDTSLHSAYLPCVRHCTYHCTCVNPSSSAVWWAALLSLVTDEEFET